MNAPDSAVLSTRLAVMHDLLMFLDGLDDVSGDDLRADMGRRLAVERALCQLVEQAVDINAHLAARVIGRAPQTQRESFDLAVRSGYVTPELAAALVPSIGKRNILVHVVDEDVDPPNRSRSCDAAATDSSDPTSMTTQSTPSPCAAARPRSSFRAPMTTR